MGRPSSFSRKKAQELLDHIESGKSVRSFKGIAQKTIFRWLDANEDFRQHYARSLERRADVWLEEIIEISDDGTNDTYVRKTKDGKECEAVNIDNINRSRLRVDARKWAMSKMLPKKYGDKLDLEGDGLNIGPTTINNHFETKPVRDGVSVSKSEKSGT